MLSDHDIRTAAFHSSTLIMNELEDLSGFDYNHEFDEGSWSDNLTGIQVLFETVKSRVSPFVNHIEIAEFVYRNLIPARFTHSPIPYVPADVVTDEAQAWIRNQRDEDFFCWVHYMDPHRPYGISLESTSYSRPPPDDEILELMSQTGKYPGKITDREHNLLINMYDDELAFTTREVSRLINELRAAGLYNDLDLYLTADHGEEFYEHGQYFHKNYPYDELIHVPLLYKSESIEPDRITETRQLIDVPPTILGSFNINPPDEFHGLPLTTSGDRTVVSLGGIYDEALSVRTDDWKLLLPTDGEPELYDLTEDPEEQTSVATDRPRVVDRLKNNVPESMVNSGFALERARNNLDSSLEEDLKHLGYLK
jgi:arylsulfatase A-like enzyme